MQSQTFAIADFVRNAGMVCVVGLNVSLKILNGVVLVGITPKWMTPKKNIGKSGQPSLKLLILRKGYRPQAGVF